MTLRWHVCLAVLLSICAIDRGAHVYGAEEAGDRIALVIGIDEYESLGALTTCRAAFVPLEFI